MPLVSRTRATLRSAEFGFLGVCVKTRVHTPRRWGEPFSAGVLVLVALVSRPLRTSWAIVGTQNPLKRSGRRAGRLGARETLPKPTFNAISSCRISRRRQRLLGRRRRGRPHRSARTLLRVGPRRHRPPRAHRDRSPSGGSCSPLATTSRGPCLLRPRTCRTEAARSRAQP